LKQSYSRSPKLLLEPVGKSRIIRSLWQDVATAIQTETTLVDQPKGIEIEYRVIAINKSGEGSPSNTVMLKRSGNPDLSGVVL
jgi:hypothetical protein